MIVGHALARLESTGDLSRSRSSQSSPSRGRDSREWRSVHASASSSSESSDAEERVSAMSPPPAGRLGVGGGRSKSDRLASLTATAPLSLALRDWIRVCGRCRALTGLARSMVVALPPLLRVRRKTTALVLSTRSLWIGMIRIGLFFASSGSSMAGGTGKCSPEPVQDFSCTGLRATISLHQLFTCLFPPCCGLSLRT